jgi:hypothetical protein
MNEELKQTFRQPPKWLCHKLQCFAEYIKIYADKNSGRFYLDIFAGSSFYPCKTDNCTIKGSEISALKSKLRKCIFIVNNPDEADLLAESTVKFKNRSHIITANCINDCILQLAFAATRYASSLAMVDPVGYTGCAVVRQETASTEQRGGHKTDFDIILGDGIT